MTSRGLCKVVINIAEITRHVIPEQCPAHGGHQMNAKSIFQCLQAFCTSAFRHRVPQACEGEHGLASLHVLVWSSAFYCCSATNTIPPLYPLGNPLLSSFPSSCPLWVPSSCSTHRGEVVSLGLKLCLLFQTPPVFMPEAETLICPQVPFLPLGHFFLLCIPPWNKHLWPLRLLVPALLHTDHMAQYSGYSRLSTGLHLAWTTIQKWRPHLWDSLLVLKW